MATALRLLAALVSSAPRDTSILITAILGALADSLDANAAVLARVDGDTLRIEHTCCRAGIALYPHDGPSAQTLLKSADMAMYCAKKGGESAYRFHTRITKAS